MLTTTSEPLATLSGTITYPAQATIPPDATLKVRLLELSSPNDPQTIGQQVPEAGATTFAITYNPANIYPDNAYVLVASIYQREQLLFASPQYPVLTQGHPTTAAITLQPPPLLHGRVAYPAQPALPPGVVITVQLVDLLSGGVFGFSVLSTQIITPTGEGPVSFALAYDPAMIDSQRPYGVDAWASAPGRLRWDAEQLAHVLTQGSPATAEITLRPPAAVAAVSGTIAYPAEPALPMGAALRVQLVNLTRGDRVGHVTREITPVGAGPVPFTIEYDPTRVKPDDVYVLYALLHVDGLPAFITTTPAPVITNGQPTTVDLLLQAPPAITTVSGTIVCPGECGLPPDARLELRVETFLGDDVPSMVGREVIAPVAAGPTRFAIAVDWRGGRDPSLVYRVDASVYVGEEVRLRASQLVLPYLPAEVVLEPENRG